ncbi:MAG: helix-turn-helix domain-containing protein [Bryobacteraceae bacterium]
MDNFKAVSLVSVADNKSQFSDTKNGHARLSEIEVTLRDAESGDEMIRRIIGSYDIGAKLRHLRLRKKIALVDLGKHTGLSASMLSQLENGKLIPTLPTLARIATVFDVGLEFFFGEKRQKKSFSVIRSLDRIRFPETPEIAVPSYYFEVLAYGATEKAVSAYLADFPPTSAGTPLREHQHEGSEFVHVLNGTLAINYQSNEHILEAGDSVYFDSSEPHSYRARSPEAARAIVVTTPPRS